MNLSSKFESGLDMVKMGQILPKTGPNLGQIGQDLIKRPREPNKTTFPHECKH